ncbi:MAG: type II toxin-antitoxin system VapC family toxin [Phycisphaerae bacterium]|nr:type II toxin-antitoxin system VapC family toxin [Phycisphaerae bacterium]
MVRPSVYLETTVVSYYTALPSRDIVVLAHQQLTAEWWHRHMHDYEVLVSALVLEEAAQGNEAAAQRRLEAMEDFPVLEITQEAENLASVYKDQIAVLADSGRDALHLAIASASGADYLVTWNCRHIARAIVRRELEGINDQQGIATPTVCTPEELLGT